MGDGTRRLSELEPPAHRCALAGCGWPATQVSITGQRESMTPRTDTDPDNLGPVVTWAQAIDAGLTPGQIQRRVRSGRWRRLRMGAYVRVSAIASSNNPHVRTEQEHVLQTVAAALVRPGTAAAAGSAALVHGLPLVSGVPPQVTLVGGPWRGRRSGLVVPSMRCDPDDLCEVDPWGIPVTSPQRTWFDVARLLTPADALSVGDRLLAGGAVTPAELIDIAFAHPGLRGVQQARWAAPHCDGRRESPAESLSALRFLEWDLPMPLLQHEFWDDEGFVGRVDFYWPEFGLIGEVDGLGKYATDSALRNEKLRELRLTRLGLRVLRWIWADLMNARGWLRAELMRAMGLAA